MKICCGWLYAISKYGYPPSLDNTFIVVREMKNVGFEFIELEGVREKNLKEIVINRTRLKSLCRELSLNVVNFCPVLPDILNSDPEKQEKALELFKTAVDLAVYFEAETIQIDSYTPAIQYKDGRIPLAKMDRYDEVYHVIVDPQFSQEKEWKALIQGVKRCNEMAEEKGLKLCLEPRVGENVSNTGALLMLFDAIPDRNFGAVLDTGHQNAQKEILPLSVEKLGNRMNLLCPCFRATRIGGASEIRIVLTIVAPLIKTTLATVSMILFLNSWNDFLWPVIVINFVTLRTIPVGIALFKDPYHIEYGPLMAARSSLLPQCSSPISYRRSM